MISSSKLGYTSACVLALASLAACSWGRRKPLAAHDVTAPLAAHGESVLVFLEQAAEISSEEA